MGIRLSKEDLRLTLETAINVARSATALPALWTSRVEGLGRLGIKTYIAALGGALLAKATDPEIDSLTQDQSAGPHGYSLRSAAELLASENKGRYHLGTTSKNPLNNRPFLGGPSRIDEFEKIHAKARPAYLLFRDCLVDLDGLTKDEAAQALTAFLRVRMSTRDEPEQAALSFDTGISIEQLLRVAESFVQQDPEHGRRAQAFAAAVLDCAFPYVELQPIHSPHPGDVRVVQDSAVRFPVEVKQVAADEAVALELASAAQQMGAKSALLFVVAQDHRPLNRERIRRKAMQTFGVSVEICESVRELVGAVAVFTGGSLDAIQRLLPTRYATRMREHEVSLEGQRRWKEMIEARN